MKTRLTNSTEVSKEKVTVYSTRNYELFNPLKRNRIISDPHVARLVESMKDRVLFSPIVVNSKGHVIDGQHRLEASKILKVPVKYVVMDDYDIDDVMSYNRSLKAWSAKDFIESYALEGRRPYILLGKLMEAYKLNLTVASTFLGSESKGKGITKTVKDGTYKNTLSYDEASASARIFNDILSGAKNIDVSPHKTILARASRYLSNHKDYDHSRMVYKLSIYSGDTELASTMKNSHFLIWLNDVYNFRSQPQNRISLLKM